MRRERRGTTAVLIFVIWGVAIFLSIAAWGGKINGIRPPANWARPIAGEPLDIDSQ